MLQGEFEVLIGKEISIEEYELIEYVYMNHPAIDDKHQIADIYKAGGLRVIADMLDTANKGRELRRQLQALRTGSDVML